jgi:hypothetical protein
MCLNIASDLKLVRFIPEHEGGSPHKCKAQGHCSRPLVSKEWADSLRATHARHLKSNAVVPLHLRQQFYPPILSTHARKMGSLGKSQEDIALTKTCVFRGDDDCGHLGINQET